MTLRDTLTHIFIFDRELAQLRSSMPDIVPTKAFREFESLYIRAYESDRGHFIDIMTDVRSGRCMNMGSYRLAEEVFSVDAQSNRSVRQTLVASVERLRRLRLLPPCVAAETVPATPPEPPPPAAAGKRTRSTRSGEASSPDPRSDDEGPGSFPERDSVIEAAVALQSESNKGCVISIAVEEWVLGVAMVDEDLESLYERQGRREFAATLKDLFKAKLGEVGVVTSRLFVADDEFVGEELRGLTVLAPPERFFREFDLLAQWRLYDASLVGNNASDRRKERLAVLDKLKVGAFEGQVFRPTAGCTMLDFFNHGKQYSSGAYRFVYCNTSDARRSSTSSGGADESEPDAKRRLSLSPAKKAMLGQDRSNHRTLSHRSVFLLQLIKVAGDISDNKFLLIQYLFHSLVLGEVPSRKEAFELCVTGETHKQRARQLLWRLNEHTVEQINLSRVIAVSCDMTSTGGVEQNSQHVYYFDAVKNSPVSFSLPSPPVGAKDANHAASALLDSCRTTGVKVDGFQGGCSDNAPNAKNTILGFFDKAEEETNGVDENGEIIRTIVNGVVKRCLFIGSTIHQLHLFYHHWRQMSVGCKVDMNAPNHIQLAYKVAAILRSDQRVSKSGPCNSIYQAIINELFGGSPEAKGWWSKLIPQEHEGRWGVSQLALAHAWRFIKTTPPGSSYSNGLAAMLMAIREHLKPSSWQLDAAYQASVWAYSIDIQFAICMEVEFGANYTNELAWLRNSSTRPYLSHYPPLFRLREFPSYRHNQMRRLVQRLKADPMAVLPDTKAFVEENVIEEDRHLFYERAQAGADAMSENFLKHSAFIYRDWGLVLMICGTGCGGAAARNMSLIAGDLLFGVHNDLKAEGLAAVEAHKEEEADLFFRPLFAEGREGVRHWLQQLCLVNDTDSEDERRSLAKEWLFLCQHTCTDPANDPVIHDEFARRLPLLHHRLARNVDIVPHDSLLDEAYFSRMRRLYDDMRSGASFEDLMMWDSTVMAELRSIGRAVGVKAREEKRMSKHTVLPEDFKDTDQKWDATHGQCFAVLEYVETKFLPLFTDELMAGAPEVRKLKTGDQRLTAKDTAQVKSWLQTAKARSANYSGRALSEELLKGKAADVKLTYQPETAKSEPIPLRPRVLLDYAAVAAPYLKLEFTCFLPFFLVCALEAPRVAWPCGIGSRRVMVGSLGLSASPASLALLSAALAPPRIVTPKAKKLVREALSKRNALVDVSIDHLFVLVAGAGQTTVMAAQVAFVKRRLGLNLSADGGEETPVDKAGFEELLRGFGQPALCKVANTIVFGKAVAAATAPQEVQKNSKALYKDRALSMLSAFRTSSIFILECLGAGDGMGACAGATGGSAAAMFILGPLMMDSKRRASIGVASPARLPVGGEGGFVSHLPEFASPRSGVVNAALLG